MSTPTVTSIHAEYSDGSVDDIKPLQRGDLPLYSLQRQRPGSPATKGAYTAEGIAALLFGTAATTHWTEYSSRDSKLAALVRSWNAAE